MKCLIVFFSQTGNTKAIARAVHKGIEPFVDECHLVRIDRADTGKMADYDLIGIGSPVWAGVPPHVRRFVDAMPVLPGKLAFTFCTHGAKGERFVPTMIRLLMEKKLTVIGSRGWYCGVSFPFVPTPYFTDGHPDSIDLEEAAGFGKHMAETGSRVLAGDTTVIPPVPPMLPPRTLIPPPVPMSLHMDRCTYPACRLCMDHCRMKIINLTVSPPIFPRKGCQTCFFCEYICPTGAIEADYEARTRFEMEAARGPFSEALDKAEAEGRFRRLTPDERIGWDTPFHEAHATHPRYVIPEEDL
jgi:ferredoxin